MSKQVRFRRGTTVQHSTFTGALGEVTVDTDLDTLVVHDGVTAGGFPVIGKKGGVIEANSASPALRITQTGSGPALLVEDSANPDSTPFVITASGSVLIGATGTADRLLHIKDAAATNGIRVETVLPVLELIESDQTLPAGAYRMDVSGGAFRWLINTHASVPFATASSPMTLASTGNLLVATTTDDGSNKLQVNGNAILNASNAVFFVGGGVGSATLRLDGAAGANRSVVGTSNGSQRWRLYLGSSVAESGSDAGSNFLLEANTDAAAVIDHPISITRASGGEILLGGATSRKVRTTAELEIDGALNHDGSTVGFYGTAPGTKQAASGSRGGNAALASLLTALSTIGLITDSSTA